MRWLVGSSNKMHLGDTSAKNKSKILDQNGISPACYTVEIYTILVWNPQNIRCSHPQVLIKLAISPHHSILTGGQPVLALTSAWDLNPRAQDTLTILPSKWSSDVRSVSTMDNVLNTASIASDQALPWETLLWDHCRLNDSWLLLGTEQVGKRFSFV